MMSLPKFLKVTPSSNLFAFRLQSTFKRYVYTKYFTTITCICFLKIDLSVTFCTIFKKKFIFYFY